MKNRNHFQNSSINFLLTALVALTFYGCLPSLGVNNQVNKYHDEFKNIDVKSFRINIASENLLDDLTNLKLDFYEENGKEKILYLSIYRNPITTPIEQILYMKTDDLIFKIPLKLLKSNFKSEKINTESIITHTDSTGSTTKTEAGSTIHEYFAELFTTDLNDEVINSILKTKTLKFRLYCGSFPISFPVKTKYLNQIKKTVVAIKN